MSLELRMFAAAVPLILAGLAHAQDLSKCYSPNGQTLTTDEPCDPEANASACCPSSAFCLSGGMCIEAGTVSRGSCTDANWDSSACASFCREESPDQNVPMILCAGNDTFSCGLSGQCNVNLPSDVQVVLRQTQIQSLLDTLADPDSSSASFYTFTQVVGVGVGVSLPLILALMIALVLLYRAKKSTTKSKFLYEIPDMPDDDETDNSSRSRAPVPPSKKPAPSRFQPPHPPGDTRPANLSIDSRSGQSVRSNTSTNTPTTPTANLSLFPRNSYARSPGGPGAYPRPDTAASSHRATSNNPPRSRGASPQNAGVGRSMGTPVSRFTQSSSGSEQPRQSAQGYDARNF